MQIGVNVCLACTMTYLGSCYLVTLVEIALVLPPSYLFAAAAEGEQHAAALKSGATDGEVALIMLERTIAKMLPDTPDSLAVMAKAVDGYYPLLNSTTGKFSDILYESVGDADRSWWPVAVHLQRALLFATAAVDARSAHHGSQPLRNATQLALGTWIANDQDNDPAFHNSNWWWEEIGLPRVVGKCLCLMSSWLDGGAMKEWIKRAAGILARARYTSSGEGTGANQVWRASAHVLWALVSQNTTMLREAYGVMQAAIDVKDHGSRQDGIQCDYSFHQHGPQLYTGWGYGAIFTTTVLDLDQVAANTSYQTSDQQMAVFADFVLRGQQLTTRGANFDFTACGRLMTYFSDHDQYGLNAGHYHYFAAFTPFENAFPRFVSPFNTPLAVNFQNLLGTVTATNSSVVRQFERFRARLAGSPGSDDLAVHKHFFTSDYTAHHRRGWAVTVRMYSTRTLNTECGNDEGKQGKTLADGVTGVYVNGSEFENTYPAWNWSLVPGTTEHQRGFPFSCAEATKVNHTEFVGGVSDGWMGLSAMNFSRSGISVHKAWVFADDFVLHMGSGAIEHAEGYTVATSLDQKALLSDVNVGIAGVEMIVTLPRGDHELKNVTWIHHGDVLYVTQVNSRGPAGGSRRGTGVSLGIFNTQRLGSWANITQGSNQTLKVDMFGAFYPNLPLASTEPFQYMYTVMPNTQLSTVPTKLAALSESLIAVANTRTLQSACLRTTYGWQLQAAFWKAGEHTAAAQESTDCWQLSSSTPAMVLMDVRLPINGSAAPPHNPPVEVTLSVANPLRSESGAARQAGRGTVTLTVVGAGLHGPNCTHTAVRHGSSTGGASSQPVTFITTVHIDTSTDTINTVGQTHAVTCEVVFTDKDLT